MAASPIEETVTSILTPGVANAGRVAVTITAATFLTRKAVGGTLTPIFCSRLDRLCVENTVCWRSPVPLRPTTMP